MINRIDGIINERDCVKYLAVSNTDRNNEIFKGIYDVFDEIKDHIKKINNNDSEYVKIT